ncbi:hypothetical protein BJV78DRAFT_1368495 [Lactifluus subvellereus]|nr:hypothetical protein BJV78DRAFT_1368495 [Lactifluus subvellereus]
MKITVKTLQQKVFQIEADPTDTVSDLKEKIKDQQGHPVEAQKIIYSGKVLSDDKTVESCQIKEKDFLVLMVSKPKSTPVASASTNVPSPVSAPPPPNPAGSTSAAPVAPAASQTEATVSSTPPATPPAPPPAEVPPAEAPALGASFLSGDALQTTIRNMEEMGFPRDQVLRALRASYNNPDRAVEYLFNGIPAHLEAEHSQPAARQPVHPVNPPASTPTATPSTASPQVAAPQNPQNLFQLAQQQQQQQQQPGYAAPGLGGLGGLGGAPAMDALRSDPQVDGLRELASQNPALLQRMIQQLAASNPQLAQGLAQNPELLYQLLNSSLGAEGGEEGDLLPPGAHVIQVTPEERDAIARASFFSAFLPVVTSSETSHIQLEALGFPRQAAIEAYFACDKNEELAANYLFERGFEDDAPP